MYRPFHTVSQSRRERGTYVPGLLQFLVRRAPAAMRAADLPEHGLQDAGRRPEGHLLPAQRRRRRQDRRRDGRRQGQGRQGRVYLSLAWGFFFGTCKLPAWSPMSPRHPAQLCCRVLGPQTALCSIWPSQTMQRACDHSLGCQVPSRYAEAPHDPAWELRQSSPACTEAMWPGRAAAAGICTGAECGLLVAAQVVVIGGGYIGLECTAGMVVNDLKARSHAACREGLFLQQAPVTGAQAPRIGACSKAEGRSPALVCEGTRRVLWGGLSELPRGGRCDSSAKHRLEALHLDKMWGSVASVDCVYHHDICCMVLI